MNLDKIINESEIKLKNIFNEIDENAYFNSNKILKAFSNHNISNSHFNGTTGYGYGDAGREIIEKVYADIFKAEAALVRNQFISGTHALTVAFFGVLRPGDTMLSITGIPYDTLHSVIGLTENASSLKAFNIDFDTIDLINNDFDYPAIENRLKNPNIKVIHIQRSIGYGNRDTLSIESLEKIITFIKNINPKLIILVDNCYCELCGKQEPTEVGADLVVGSLIKNLGAGIASNGAYIIGNKDLVELCAERLTSPGLGSEVGPSLGMNKNFLLGLYLAPSVIASALKVKMLTNEIMTHFNFQTINNNLHDIVLGIVFNDRDKLIKYVQTIQKYSAIDSFSEPIPSSMPGYDHDIIMASGSFTDGSSIELSCDAPLKEPYIAYQQGSLTYEYGKIAISNAIKNILD